MEAKVRRKQDLLFKIRDILRTVRNGWNFLCSPTPFPDGQAISPNRWEGERIIPFGVSVYVGNDECIVLTFYRGRTFAVVENGQLSEHFAADHRAQIFILPRHVDSALCNRRKQRETKTLK